MRWGRREIPIEERKCTLSNVVEDEFHCLFECERYTNERRGCIPDKLKERPSMYEFINYLKNDSEPIYRKLGLLCFKVQMKYKEYI